MKKIYFLSFFISLFAAQLKAVELQLSNETGSKGSQVTLKLTTKDFTNVIGVQFSINFDPAVLQYVSHTTTNPVATGYDFGTNNTALGQIAGVWIDPALIGLSVSDNIELMRVTFKIIGGVGTTTNVTISDTPTPFVALDGGLAYTATTSVGGSVQVTAILPIELSAFSAKLTDKTTAELNWQTMTERNVSHFWIEYGHEGKNFLPIGEVKAKGNSTTPQYYRFSHTNLRPIVHYYRLKMVDADGKFDYSKIVSISQNTERSVLIQKRGKELIVNGLLSNTEVTISLSDIMGRTVFLEKKQANTEESLFQYLPTLSSGLYIATIRSKQQVQSAKIFIE